MSADEKLDVEGAIKAINAALRLQCRSVLQYSLASGSLFGFEFQALGDRLCKVAELHWTGEPGEAVQWLIDTEEEE
jgi:hypothetical protein